MKKLIILISMIFVVSTPCFADVPKFGDTIEAANLGQESNINLLQTMFNPLYDPNFDTALPQLAAFCVQKDFDSQGKEWFVMHKNNLPWKFIYVEPTTTQQQLEDEAKKYDMVPICLYQIGGAEINYRSYTLLNTVSWILVRNADSKIINTLDEDVDYGWLSHDFLNRLTNVVGINVAGDRVYDFPWYISLVIPKGSDNDGKSLFNQVKNVKHHPLVNKSANGNILTGIGMLIGGAGNLIGGGINNAGKFLFSSDKVETNNKYTNKLKTNSYSNYNSEILSKFINKIYNNNLTVIQSMTETNSLTNDTLLVPFTNLNTYMPDKQAVITSYAINVYRQEILLNYTLSQNKSSEQLFKVEGTYTEDNPYNPHSLRNIFFEKYLIKTEDDLKEYIKEENRSNYELVENEQYDFDGLTKTITAYRNKQDSSLFPLKEMTDQDLMNYYGFCLSYGIQPEYKEVYKKGGNISNKTNILETKVDTGFADFLIEDQKNTTALASVTLGLQYISDTHSIWTLGLALTGCTSPIDKDYQAKVVELLPYVKDTIAIKLTNPELNPDTGKVNATLGEYTKIALALTNYRKVLKLGVDKKTAVSVYNNNCISLGDILSRDTYALYVDDGFYDINTDEIINTPVIDEEEYKKDGGVIPPVATGSSVLLKELYYNDITDNFISWEKIKYGRAKTTYRELGKLAAEELSDISKASNKILTVDKFGYRTGNIPAFINWLYLNELKNNTMFIANTDLSLPVFCDAYGNIITADNRMVLPAISNNLLTTPGPCEKVGQIWNTLYQSRAVSNILNYKFEIPPEAYSQLQKFFLIRRLPEDPTTEVYNIYSKFITEAVNGKYYIYLAPESYVFKEHQQDGTDKDLKIVYNKALYDNQNLVAKYLEAVLCYITQGDLESVTVDIGGTSETIDVKSELLKQSKGTFIVCYIANTSRIIVYALCGAKDTEINQYIKVCLDKMDFDRLSIAISGILDMFTDLFNTLNFGLFSRVFDGWSDNQLNLIQLIASLLIYFTIICLVISIIVKFNDSNIFKLIMTVVSIVLLLLLPSGLNLISSVVEKTVSQDIIDASLLAELSSEHKGYKQGITKNYEVKSNRLLLGIEEDKFPIFSAFASILSLNSEYTIKDTITKKAGENILNTSSTLIHRNMTSYGLDIVKSIGNIGIRNTSDRAVFTYTEAENVLNFYTLTLPMMSIATKRINNIYKGVINSNIDTRFSEIQDINKTYGLSYYYISRLNYHADYYKDSTKDGYDYTGLLALFKDVLTDKNTGDIKDYVADDSNIDQSQQIGSFDVNSIFDEFNTKETLPYEYALDHKDKLYKACIEANNAYLKALNKLYQSSTSYDDTVIIYFASLKAALAFNKELGLQQNTIVLKNLANDSILVSLLNGTNAALTSAGKTSGRYLYDTYQDNSIMLIIYTMVFIFLNVVIIAKNLVIFVILAIFIYSIIKIGINKDNIEGLALNSVLLVSMICITYFTFNTLILVSSNSNSPILNLIVTTVTLIFYLNFLLNLTKGLFEDAISAGKNAVTSLLQPLNSMKDNIKRSVNNKFNGVTPINTNITYNGELNVSKKYNSQTRVTNKIEKLASKYDDKLEIGKLARSIVQGVDNG